MDRYALKTEQAKCLLRGVKKKRNKTEVTGEVDVVENGAD